MRCILNMKMKKTDYIRILSLLLAAIIFEYYRCCWQRRC